MWPGVQPNAQDSFSAAYVQKVRRIVDSASLRGIHTLLDMHQDVISENMCGEGIYSICYSFDLNSYVIHLTLCCG